MRADKLSRTISRNKGVGVVEMLANTGVDALMMAPKNPLRCWRQLKAVRSFIDGFHAVPRAVRADPECDAPPVRALAEAIHDLSKYERRRVIQRSSAPFTGRIPS